MATTKKRGPRATVLFKAAQGKDNPALYIYPLRSVAEKLGLKIVVGATVTRKPSKTNKSKKEIKVAVRGSFGAKRIKVPVPGTTSSSASKKGATAKYLSLPVPAGANISDITKFLQSASKKPASFVSPDGRTYPLTTQK